MCLWCCCSGVAIVTVYLLAVCLRQYEDAGCVCGFNCVPKIMTEKGIFYKHIRPIHSPSLSISISHYQRPVKSLLTCLPHYHNTPRMHDMHTWSRARRATITTTSNLLSVRSETSHKLMYKYCWSHIYGTRRIHILGLMYRPH